MPEPLVQVTAPLRCCRPKLPTDVVHHVSSFLDRALYLSLAQGARTGSTQVFDRVLSCIATRKCALLGCEAIRRSWFLDAMIASISKRDFAMVQHIHDLHPQPLGVVVFKAAASTDAATILEWLLLHRCEDRRWTATKNQRQYRLALLMELIPWHAHDQLPHIWRMLKSNSPEPPGFLDPLYDAVRQGDLSQLQQLHTSGAPMQRDLVDMAIDWKQFHVAKWLCEELGMTRLEGEYGILAWLSQVPELMAMFPADFAASVSFDEVVGLVCGRCWPIRVHLREHFTSEDASTIEQSERYEFLELVVSMSNVGNLQWVVEDCRWSLTGEETRSLLYWKNDWTSAKDILDYLRAVSQPWTDGFATSAVSRGHMKAIEYIHEYCGGQWEAQHVVCAGEAGCLDVVRWFHDKLDFVGGPEAMDTVASAGQVHIMEWLHTNRSDGCTVEAINRAARNGHVEAVAWLHRYRCEWDETQALQCAIESRRALVVKYLLDEGLATCSFAEEVGELLDDWYLTSDTVLVLIESAGVAGVKLPRSLLDRAVACGLGLVVDRLCAHLEVDAETREMLMDAAARNLGHGRSFARRFRGTDIRMD